jgi:hypothetical protein
VRMDTRGHEAGKHGGVCFNSVAARSTALQLQGGEGEGVKVGGGGRADVRSHGGTRCSCVAGHIRHERGGVGLREGGAEGGKQRDERVALQLRGSGRCHGRDAGTEV